jgi:hypothetical protein
MRILTASEKDIFLKNNLTIVIGLVQQTVQIAAARDLTLLDN